MAKIGSCYEASFSPDGSRIAFLSDLSGLPQVWTVSRDGGWPDKVTALDDPVRDVSWSPDGAWLALSVAPGGGMNTQIYLVRPEGTGLRLLTAGGKDNNWLGPWSHDGQYLALSSNREDDESMDCYLADTRTGELRRIARNRGTGRVTDISRDARWAIVQRVVHRSDANLILMNLESGEETVLTPHEGPGSFGAGTFSPDGRRCTLPPTRTETRQPSPGSRSMEQGSPGRSRCWRSGTTLSWIAFR
jgi:Tol biopolymer transport system component